MKLVVGLGNPGKQYTGTRHNVGFEVIAELARRFGVGKPKSKFDAELAEVMMGMEKVILVSPLTFMNLSGQSVRSFVDFYKLDCEDLLVICDDLNLDVGRLRVRAKGSAGGQNGLKDIINRLGTQEFPRLRVGVGRLPPQWDAADFVLGKFDEVDREIVNKGVRRAADAVEFWVKEDALKTMTKFNADPNAKPKPKPKKKKPDEDLDSKDESKVDSGSEQSPSDSSSDTT
jgi:PTH1 family peptidyl-tRNA hydrolase